MPVIVLLGPLQVGKTTLAMPITESRPGTSVYLEALMRRLAEG